MAQSTNPEPITESDVKNFSTKLQQWGENLPGKERALLHLLLARCEAAGSDLEAHDAGSTNRKMIDSMMISKMLSPIQLGGAAASGWVEAGDPWVQGGSGIIDKFINPGLRRL